MTNKFLKISILIFVLSLFNYQTAAARKSAFFSFGGETIIKVQDFPDTELFQMENGSYVDAGCIYKQVSIFFIPVWNYDIRWCGYTGEDGNYVILSKEELDAIAQEASITLPATPTLSFWHSIGGKLLFVVVIGAFIAYSVFFAEEEEEEEEPKEEKQ
ncbi:hypothetical protein [Aureispira anguillae]|uniref:Uncharacterized protein n=1 Tax=Aureispira anguillae TaxID=2864201 RepID=A0A916DPZ2_9BACT|nr:hypothetical protein [Aureispira anguillae]BDS09790.1 hypothetical protein AsAng_0004950 [Aureispira anguillae]